LFLEALWRQHIGADCTSADHVFVVGNKENIIAEFFPSDTKTMGTNMEQQPLTPVRLGACGPTVSRLCLSGLALAADSRESAAFKLFENFQAAGGNFIEVTEGFAGERVQSIAGRALRSIGGDWVIAAGASLAQSPNSISKRENCLAYAVEKALQRLGLDRLDIVYLRLDQQSAGLEQPVEAVGELMETGLIGGWGFSHLPAWRIAELIWIADCLDIPRPIAARPYYHALHRQAEKDYLPACSHFRLGAVTDACLARELLAADQSEIPASSQDGPLIDREARPAALDAVNAIAHYLEPSGREIMKFTVQWVLANRLVSSVVIRPRSTAELDVYLRAADIPYTADDEAFVDRLVPSGAVIGSMYREPMAMHPGRLIA
jgi:aryl-alcohol dehydrogenase-like predicted oxidoreductase